MKTGWFWNCENAHPEPDPVMIVCFQRCQTEFKMNSFCDNNARSQNNSGYFCKFWFVSHQPTPGICQAPRMAKVQLSLAWDKRPEGDGCRWVKERLLSYICICLVVLSLNIATSLNTHTDTDQHSCTKECILEQDFPDSICCILMSV